MSTFIRGLSAPRDGNSFQRHQQPNDLFDLRKDPGEHHNLADDSDYTEVSARLSQKIDQFFLPARGPQV